MAAFLTKIAAGLVQDAVRTGHLLTQDADLIAVARKQKTQHQD